MSIQPIRWKLPACGFVASVASYFLLPRGWRRVFCVAPFILALIPDIILQVKKHQRERVDRHKQALRQEQVSRCKQALKGYVLKDADRFIALIEKYKIRVDIADIHGSIQKSIDQQLKDARPVSIELLYLDGVNFYWGNRSKDFVDLARLFRFPVRCQQNSQLLTTYCKLWENHKRYKQLVNIMLDSETIRTYFSKAKTAADYRKELFLYQYLSCLPKELGFRKLLRKHQIDAKGNDCQSIANSIRVGIRKKSQPDLELLYMDAVNVYIELRSANLYVTIMEQAALIPRIVGFSMYYLHSNPKGWRTRYDQYCELWGDTWKDKSLPLCLQVGLRKDSGQWIDKTWIPNVVTIEGIISGYCQPVVDLLFIPSEGVE